MKRWKAENRTAVLAVNARYRSQNREKRRKYAVNYNADYYARNRGYFAEWKRENADRHRAAESRRRGRKRGAIPEGREEDVRLEELRLRALQQLYRNQGVEVELDHIVPLSRGGLHVPENFRLISARDNRRKWYRLDSELDFEIHPLPPLRET